MAITKNIVTDYGATTAAGNDDGPAFYTGLKPDMQGQDCDLTIPAGTYDMTTRPGGVFFWATGMTSLNVTATGATMNDAVLGSLHMSQIGIDEASGKSARVRSVAAGATNVQLTAASAAAGHISRAVVGRWMMMSGYDTQGLFQAAYGFPPNAHFVQFVQITAVGADTISFTPALRDSYLDTWPEFNRGSAGEVDSGGPATVFFLHPDWDHTTVFDGLIPHSANNIICTGKDFTIRNGGSTSGLPVYPTVNKDWTAIDHDISLAGEMELDKFVDTATFDGGPAHQFKCQSSSVYQWNLLNTTMDGAVIGTARNTLIDNCVIGGGVFIGPSGYGRGDTFICRNTSIAGAIQGGYIEKGPDDRGWHTCATMSNGVITVPMVLGAGRAFAPDPYGRNVVMWMSQASLTLGGFRVLSVTGDPWPALDNQSVTTNVTMSSVTNKKNLGVSTSIFSASDVGKVIYIGGAGSGGNSLRTFITGFTDAQNVTVYHDCVTTLSASSRTVQWGTCNYYVQTDQSGGLPSASLYTTLWLYVPGTRTVSFDNVTGSALATDLSQIAARNRPLYSYSKRTYNGTTVSGNVLLYGNIVSIKVNVLTAYTGGGAAFNLLFSPFSNMGTIVGGADLSYAPVFDLKTVGERIITPSGVVGAVGADSSLSIGSSPRWVKSGFGVNYSRNIDAEAAGNRPSFTIEFITDQGFYTGPTAVAPLRLRLRAA